MTRQIYQNITILPFDLIGLGPMLEGWRKSQTAMVGPDKACAAWVVYDCATAQTFLTSPELLGMVLGKEPEQGQTYQIRSDVWDKLPSQKPLEMLHTCVWVAEEGLPPPFLPEERRRWLDEQEEEDELSME